MAINTNDFFKGTGIAYFKRTGENTYRDLGSVAKIDEKPQITKSDKFAARGGKRYRAKTYVTLAQTSYDLVLDEWNPDNLALALGGIKTAAVHLVTTADTAVSPALTNLASHAGLVPGRRYWISGAGLLDNTSFIYPSAAAVDVTLDRAATAIAVGVAVTITCPIAFASFDQSQVTGSFCFVSDNDVGPRLVEEAFNCIITPSGTLTKLDSGGDALGEIDLTLDVYQDDFGNFVQRYNAPATIWVPA